MKQYLEWTEEMSVGVDALDEDHKILLNMIRHCSEIAGNGKNSVEIGRVLADLHGYVGDHFDREESVMAACGYPYLENHKEVHTRLKNRVEELLEGSTFDKDKAIADEVFRFLKDFFENHILGMDSNYKSWVVGKEKEISKALSTLESEVA